MSVQKLPPTPYTPEFYEDQWSNSLASARRVVPHLLSILGPKSVIDVGCGVGTWLAAFRELGVEDVVGLDGDYVKRERLLIPDNCFFSCDLRKALPVTRKFDLAMSLEVGEHLPAEASEFFVASIVRLAPVILFSAAVPGQGGTDHINEQWPAYWKTLFQQHGYQLVDSLREIFWNDPAIGGCYKQNMFLYVDVNSKANVLIPEPKGQQLPLSIIHPDVFENAMSRPITLRPLLRAIPNALRLAINKRAGGKLRL